MDWEGDRGYSPSSHECSQSMCMFRPSPVMIGSRIHLIRNGCHHRECLGLDEGKKGVFIDASIPGSLHCASEYHPTPPFVCVCVGTDREGANVLTCTGNR